MKTALSSLLEGNVLPAHSPKNLQKSPQNSPQKNSENTVHSSAKQADAKSDIADTPKTPQNESADNAAKEDSFRSALKQAEAEVSDNEEKNNTSDVASPLEKISVDLHQELQHTLSEEESQSLSVQTALGPKPLLLDNEEALMSDEVSLADVETLVEANSIIAPVEVLQQNKVFDSAKKTLADTAALTSTISSTAESATKVLNNEQLLKQSLQLTSNLDADNIVVDKQSTLLQNTNLQSTAIEATTKGEVVTTAMAERTTANQQRPAIAMVDVSVQQKVQWGEAVAEKVLWMSAKGVKEATIQLDPPELGPMTVKVSVTQEQAQVSFTTQYTTVKEALDQNANRLRELFAEEGMNLTDVDVSDHSQSESQEREEGEQGLAQSSENWDEAEVSETVISSEAGQYHLVNTYI